MFKRYLLHLKFLYFTSNSIKIKVEVKVNLVPVRAMKTHKGAEASLYSFLTSELNGREWSTSHPNHFIPGEEPRYPLNMRVGGPQSWSG
jgi:hypothetical protein